MGGTTGVSLEQGLGLTDMSQHCTRAPGRAVGLEASELSSLPDYYFIINEINPSF